MEISNTLLLALIRIHLLVWIGHRICRDIRLSCLLNHAVTISTVDWLIMARLIRLSWISAVVLNVSLVLSYTVKLINLRTSCQIALVLSDSVALSWLWSDYCFTKTLILINSLVLY